MTSGVDCETCEYSPGAIYQHAPGCGDDEDGAPNLCSGTGVHFEDCNGRWIPCPECQEPEKPERALIYGSRTWRDRAAIEAFVLDLPDGSVVIHGGAEGADSIAGEAAQARGLEVVVFRANWWAHGRAAGPIRNQRMIDEGQPTVARGYRRGFKSPGTDDMTRRLEKAGIPHEVIAETEPHP